MAAAAAMTVEECLLPLLQRLVVLRAPPVVRAMFLPDLHSCRLQPPVVTVQEAGDTGAGTSLHNALRKWVQASGIAG